MAEIVATVLVSVRDRERWIGDQIRSLIAQWRGDCELIVFDDGSIDQSSAAARQALSGAAVEAVFMRNARPQGLRALDQLIASARGRIIILADSDDVSLPGRLDALIATMRADDRCRLVTSNLIDITADGTPIGLGDTTGSDAVFDDPSVAFGRRGDRRWLGATMAFDRTLVSRFPIDADRCADAFDLLLPPRAVLDGTHRYLSDPLILYRRHSGNLHLDGGLGSAAPHLMERSASTEVMILLQRLRDLDGELGRLHPLSSELRATASALLEESLDIWSVRRLAVRQVADGPDRRGSAPPPVPPPIITLRPGVPLPANASTASGRLLGLASGMHAPETAFTWTERRALISLRVPIGSELRLTLQTGLDHPGRSEVVARVDGGPWHRCAAEGPEYATTSFAIQHAEDRNSDLIRLEIHAPGAFRPAETFEGNRDGRLLGAPLKRLEVV